MKSARSGFGHHMPFGAELVEDGVRFRLWAPTAGAVVLRVDGREGTIERALDDIGEGWREAIVAEARPGDRYAFVIDGDLAVPDPASRHQPRDVHGPSEIIDPHAYVWQTPDWHGRPREETVFYELHVGTFTPEGTFRSAIERLDYLVDLGVTAVELMPVADFPGAHDWGYNGTLLFAPDATYGRPDDLKALIDAAHARGLMVFLDVVYNHFGPEGNYLHVYAKSFFDESRHTPWGAAINFSGSHASVVRRFFVENVLYWLDEYRFDGLRFDAVHAIDDPSEPHILAEIAETVHERIDRERHVHLVLENDHNEAHWLARAGDSRPRHYDAQWCDDWHHAAHVLLTGEHGGYYADYAQAPAQTLARCLAEGFAYQGDPSAFRDGAARGEKSAQLPPTDFVAFLQNHDQIGNRAMGDRLVALSSPEATRAAAAVLLLAPQPPLLFMGEEWGAAEPFQFFCDFGEDLKESVREGRRREFASFPEFADPSTRAMIPDPTAAETFRRSRLDWQAPAREPHATTLAHYRHLLALRRQEIVPRLAQIGGHAGRIVFAAGHSLVVEWRMGDASTLRLAANLGPEPSPPLPADDAAARTVYASTAIGTSAGTSAGDGALPPWSVRCSVCEATRETGEETN